MKHVLQIFCLILLFLGSFMGVDAAFFDQFSGQGSPEIRYCDDPGECGLERGTQIIRGEVDGLETDRSLSEYVQDVVLYLLTFISLIAVIYVIYAGFQILIGNGDEEKLKKSKLTIIYVVLGIAVIWLAWPITLFIMRALSA
ncbi:hypothetical protein GW846_05320 [Candidatus Gracilibacteria bacterium]|nr:hypothetical protein [Candidatus Gracilibacteria bacterium]